MTEIWYLVRSLFSDKVKGQLPRRISFQDIFYCVCFQRLAGSECKRPSRHLPKQERNLKA